MSENETTARPPSSSHVRASDNAYSDGFVVAALAAPIIALAVFLIGLVASAQAEGLPGSIWQAAGSLLFVLLIVFITGAIPSLVFGGAVLALIRAMRTRRTPIVCAIGGGIAAALYVVVSIWIAFVAPGGAIFFAPWAALLAMDRSVDLAAHIEAGHFWPAVCIVISGVVAGLIYARLTQRG